MRSNLKDGLPPKPPHASASAHSIEQYTAGPR
jgi:hypothetical protein